MSGHGLPLTALAACVARRHPAETILDDPERNEQNDQNDDGPNRKWHVTPDRVEGR